MGANPPSTCRTILLRHTLPNGTAHFDWMVDPGGDRPLMSFRVGSRIDELVINRATPSAGFDAERIGDHRRDYLDYEGPISGDRGRVERIARGTCAVERESDAEFIVTLNWGSGPVHLVGKAVELGAGTSTPSGSRHWRFDVA